MNAIVFFSLLALAAGEPPGAASRGKTKLKQRDYDGAYQEFSGARAAGDHRPSTTFGLALTEYFLEKFPAAREHFLEYLELCRREKECRHVADAEKSIVLIDEKIARLEPPPRPPSPPPVIVRTSTRAAPAIVVEPPPRPPEDPEDPFYEETTFWVIVGAAAAIAGGTAVALAFANPAERDVYGGSTGLVVRP